ncbi:MAG: helix-turn-helix transcriptional regulator, partial [Gemmiger sp.]
QWDMLSLQCSDGSSYLLFSRSAIGQSGDVPNATAVVAIDLSLLTERLRQFTWDSRLNLYAVHPDGTLVCGTAGDEVLDVDPAGLQPSDHFARIPGSSQPRSMLVRGSANSEWNYLLLVSNSLLAQSARRIRLYTFFGLLVCMAVSLVLSLRLAQRNYHPLVMLMEYFSSQKDAAPLQVDNEYEQLEAYVQSFFEKRSQEQHDLWNSQQSLRKYCLYTLLERPGRANLSQPSGESLLPPAAAYLVVVFSIPRLENHPARQQLSFDLLQYAISNIFEEVAGAHFTLSTTNTGEGVAAIVGLDSHDDPLPLQLEEDIQFTQQQMTEHFHLAVSAAAGAPHGELSGIYYSYMEAMEASSYLRSETHSDFVAYRAIQDAQSSYTFPLEEEWRLITLVAAGDAENARALLTQLFDSLPAKQEVRSASVVRCLAYDAVSALNKAASMAGVSGVSVGKLAELAHCSPQELPAYLGQQAAYLCDQVRQQAQESTPNSRICEKICAYIRENFQDPDLNISRIGQHFDRTPAYLSAIFKKETGTSLLNYITQVRLDAVKALLLQGLPIARIAEQTGFRDSGSLIRVFKRATGTTPGQYREGAVSGQPEQKS